MPSPPVDDVSCAEVLRVLANDTRLAVVRRLLEGSALVHEINASLGVDQSLFSHHLRVLREAGLVTTARDGKGVRYELSAALRTRRRGEAIDLGCCKLVFS